MTLHSEKGESFNFRTRHQDREKDIVNTVMLSNINRLTARMVLEETRNKSVKGGGENTAYAAFFVSHPSKMKEQVEEGIDGGFAVHSGYRGR